MAAKVDRPTGDSDRPLAGLLADPAVWTARTRAGADLAVDVTPVSEQEVILPATIPL
jgi:hypothetical protein